MTHLEHASFRMFTTTSEQTRRFNPEISNFLFPTIQQTSLVLVFYFILLCFEYLLLCRREFLLLGFLGFEVSENWSEITFVEIFDLGSIELNIDNEIPSVKEIRDRKE